MLHECIEVDETRIMQTELLEKYNGVSREQ